MYTKRQNPAKSKMGTIMAKCLIITVFVTLLASCSVPQTVRYSKTQARSPKEKKESLAKKAKKIDDELYIPESGKKATDKSIKEFEQLLLKGKNTPKTDVAQDTEAPVERKRIPTLREQMLTLGDNQVAIRREMETMKSDMNDIRQSVDEIKKAVYGINDIVQGNLKAAPITKKIPNVRSGMSSGPT